MCIAEIVPEVVIGYAGCCFMLGTPMCIDSIPSVTFEVVLTLGPDSRPVERRGSLAASAVEDSLRPWFVLLKGHPALCGKRRLVSKLLLSKFLYCCLNVFFRNRPILTVQTTYFLRNGLLSAGSR